MLAVAAMFVVAGGFVHLREWLEIYRDVPAQVPGSLVVRLGFPLNAAASAVIAAALAVCAARRVRFAPQVVVAAVLFQATSLAALIATRTGSLFGWMETGWTVGASQTRAVEIGALVALAAVALLAWQDRQAGQRRVAAAAVRVTSTR
jgi:hypothetical protein